MFGSRETQRVTTQTVVSPTADANLLLPPPSAAPLSTPSSLCSGRRGQPSSLAGSAAGEGAAGVGGVGEPGSTAKAHIWVEERETEIWVSSRPRRKMRRLFGSAVGGHF